MSPRGVGRISRRAQIFALLSVIGVLLTVTVLGYVTGRLGGHADVLWRGGYESGVRSWGDWHVQANPGDAVVEAHTVRQGRYAAKFSIGPGDVPIHASGERAQVYVDQALTNGYDGKDVWYAWSTQIAPGSVLHGGSWNDLTAWHQTGPVCPAPMHVAITGPTRMLRLDAWGGTLDPTICSNPYRRTWNLGKLQFGKWYDFVFHVKWSPDPSVGVVEMWINGRHVLPPTHAATLYTGQGVYLKQGLDRGGADGTAVIYNDGTVVARNYAGAITAFPGGTWPSAGGRWTRGLVGMAVIIAGLVLLAAFVLRLPSRRR
jgi:hypothetical protein